MHRDYADIRDRIPESPQWWDEYAAPRYAPFAPSLIDVYADEAALLLIACQGCGMQFQAAMALNLMDRLIAARLRNLTSSAPTLADQIADKTIHYGDPPNVRCCGAGPTMNCIDLRVLEYWRRGDMREWERVPALEIAIESLEDY